MGESGSVVDYLLASSKPSLESFELARMNQVANLRREFRDLLDKWINAEIEARMARWILEQRASEAQTVLLFPESQPVPLRPRGAGRRELLCASSPVRAQHRG